MRVAINGFGRIGRNILRLGLRSYSKTIDIVAINDLTDVATLAHLFKYDSVHRTFAGNVSTEGDFLVIDGKKILVVSEPDISKLPWKKLKIDLVLECTGIFRKKSEAGRHLSAGAKKVIISAPSPDPDISLVMGVNENLYDKNNHHVISNASCTTNCLGMVTQVCDENFGIEQAQMTTIHSYTRDQQLLDAPHKDLRRARAAGLSMIPTTTGAATVLTKIFPHLQNKFTGISIRVPTSNVSLVDMVMTLKKKTTAEEMNQAFKKAAESKLKKYLGYCMQPLVSTDFIGDERSAIVDALSTNVVDGNFAKVIAWYDNEVGFSARMLDIAEHVS